MTYIWVVSALALCLGCQSDKAKGEDLVQMSVEVHGGIDAYRNLDSLSWDKTTRLFGQDGGLESEKLQRQTYLGGTTPTVVLQWIQDGTFYQIESQEAITRYHMGDVVLSTGDEVEQAKKQAESAAYVFFQPFKLLDPGTELIHEGKRELGDTLEVDVVRVRYEYDDEASDVWRYYFDKDHQLVANSVLHQGRISLIVNLEYQKDPRSGLLFNKRRRSYFVDSTLQIKYLRADYLYEIQ
ncbi:hypothetical protein [Aureitalea marina]|uniref:Uncharacterized protein n=1 Tax=Aureitalea marina TaxID=930804 RepID=A0A2S7KLW0_9FLAO|nr:hypothetical protein [Aureitalea marina]PQB03588.1 hypothetical protein BST85_00745 [Aureitalea marina]